MSARYRVRRGTVTGWYVVNRATGRAHARTRTWWLAWRLKNEMNRSGK